MACLNTTTLTIRRNDPVRNEIASLPDYYDFKGDALNAIDDVLNSRGMCIGNDVRMDGDEGSLLIPIVANEQGSIVCDNCDRSYEVAGYNNGVNVSWYRMQSGRIEVIKYIS
jgi:hypothetical protein